jgi:hypothetical protein
LVGQALSPANRAARFDERAALTDRAAHDQSEVSVRSSRKQGTSQFVDARSTEASDVARQHGFGQAYQFIAMDARIRFQAFIHADAHLGLQAIVP